MLLIFSDLDATLLDHHSYSFDDALPALQLIKDKKIPLILASSKTYEEMINIQSKLGVTDPFIYENGSGIFFKSKKIALGKSYSQIIKILQGLKNDFSFTSFSQLGPSGIQKKTGLDDESSQRASLREFSEPLIWEDSENKLEIFKVLLKKQGLVGTQGGRFITISSAQTKGDALLWVKKRYQEVSENKIVTIGLGDSENDINMLSRVDKAIIVRHPNRPPPIIKNNPTTIVTTLIGPKGWNEAIIDCIDSI
jgi:mannosyl-3-phosphoglycerate phosphatase